MDDPLIVFMQNCTSMIWWVFCLVTGLGVVYAKRLLDRRMDREPEPLESGLEKAGFFLGPLVVRFVVPMPFMAADRFMAASLVAGGVATVVLSARKQLHEVRLRQLISPRDPPA